jgi:hypothetical protein
MPYPGTIFYNPTCKKVPSAFSSGRPEPVFPLRFLSQRTIAKADSAKVDDATRGKLTMQKLTTRKLTDALRGQASARRSTWRWRPAWNSSAGPTGSEPHISTLRASRCLRIRCILCDIRLWVGDCLDGRWLSRR